MRAPLLAALLLPFATASDAGANYSACIEAKDPPACIARKALTDGQPTSGDVADAIIKHGLVDMIPKHSTALVTVVKGAIAQDITLLKTLGVPIEENHDRQTARTADPKLILAAAALLTAARHEANPFADPLVQSLSAKASNHPMIPFVALWFLQEQVIDGNPFDINVEFAGLPEIWRRTLAARETAPDVAYELVTASTKSADVESRDFVLWYASRPTLSASKKAETASVLARYFSLADEAERLMKSGGDAAPDYDVESIHAEIATVRLASRYDAKDARLVADDVRKDYSRIGSAPWMGEDPRRVALERSGAKAELREIAEEHLRLARANEGVADAADLFASASDCYRRAGDLGKALEAAREGLPGVEAGFRNRTVEGSRERLAAKAQGHGTAPVIALYRAGAIEEARKFGYLAGKDRFHNAEIAGVQRDPQWVLDDGWPLYISTMVDEAVQRGPQVWRQQVFVAMSKWCAAQHSQCDDERNAELATLAATIGEETRMRQYLGGRARELDKGDSDPSAAVELAAQWAHAMEYLR